MTIRLACDRVRQSRNATWMARRKATREAGHREVEAAPEKVHGTILAKKARAEALEHAVGRYERMEVTCHRLRIVRPLRLILREWGGVGYLVRLAKIVGREIGR